MTRDVVNATSREIRRIGTSLVRPKEPSSAVCIRPSELPIDDCTGSLLSGESVLRPPRGGGGLAAELGRAGILVEASQWGLLAEEAPYAYKEVSTAVDICEGAGLSKKVARLRPPAVVKGRRRVMPTPAQPPAYPARGTCCPEHARQSSRSARMSPADPCSTPGRGGARGW
ncbi:MAG: RtcB family protein [Actinomycetota bacterium]